MKMIIFSVLMINAAIASAQTFYVMDENNGVGAPIKQSLLKSSQKVSELPTKAEYIIKFSLETDASGWKRPKVKILLVDVATGTSLYETPESKFSYDPYIGMAAAEAKAAKNLMKKYGSDLILSAQKNFLESQIQNDSTQKK
jgi:hypothetical protein